MPNICHAHFIVTFIHRLFQYNPVVLDLGDHQRMFAVERILSPQLLRMAECTEPFLHMMPRLEWHSLCSSTNCTLKIDPL